jgi:hypothetical protein
MFASAALFCNRACNIQSKRSSKPRSAIPEGDSFLEEMQFSS